MERIKQKNIIEISFMIEGYPVRHGEDKRYSCVLNFSKEYKYLHCKIWCGWFDIMFWLFLLLLEQGEGLFIIRYLKKTSQMSHNAEYFFTAKYSYNSNSLLKF